MTSQVNGKLLPLVQADVGRNTHDAMDDER